MLSERTTCPSASSSQAVGRDQSSPGDRYKPGGVEVLVAPVVVCFHVVEVAHVSATLGSW